jgi:hypothetical protein
VEEQGYRAAGVCLLLLWSCVTVSLPRHTVALHPQYWTGLTYRDDDVVRTVMMVLWGVFEPIRLAAGWYGNLQETVGVTVGCCNSL